MLDLVTGIVLLVIAAVALVFGARDLDRLEERVYDLDADTVAEAITARAEGLRAALQTAGVGL